jgi:hypothetical protein
MSPFSIGLLIVLAGAVMQGSWALPQKFVRGWAWEKMWLLYSVAAMIVFPWLFVSLMIPRAGEAYASVSTGVLVRTALFGAGWGLGSVLFGLGIAAVGLALGFAIIISLTAALGTLVPMAILHPERFTFQRGGLLILGLLVVIAGVSLCAKAGAIKDAGASATKGNFTRGLLICIASGIASPMFNFGFAFGGLRGECRVLCVPARAQPVVGEGTEHGPVSEPRLCDRDGVHVAARLLPVRHRLQPDAHGPTGIQRGLGDPDDHHGAGGERVGPAHG